MLGFVLLVVLLGGVKFFEASLCPLGNLFYCSTAPSIKYFFTIPLYSLLSVVTFQNFRVRVGPFCYEDCCLVE